MKCIYKNIYVGTLDDYNKLTDGNWAIVHACKEPSHREMVGYRGNLPPNHINYMLIEKDDRLALNLVDIDSFSELYATHHEKMLLYTLDYIKRKTKEGKNILIHCNMGQSRSPSIALLYLRSIGYFKSKSFEEAELEFKDIYCDYYPGKNIRENVKRLWNKFN